ncbi:MAG: hypothetical protein K6G71_05990 [Clostridiales bacterium]|nr:hypothetical protein [Clostridiales bacterium]
MDFSSILDALEQLFRILVSFLTNLKTKGWLQTLLEDADSFSDISFEGLGL